MKLRCRVRGEELCQWNMLGTKRAANPLKEAGAIDMNLHGPAEIVHIYATYLK